MKELTSKQKITYIAVLAIILVGIIVMLTVGFNLGLMYSNNKRIDVYIGKNFSLNDIKDISNETLEGKTVIQTVELLDDYVSVTVKDASEEQIDNFKTKIVEKYNVSEDLQKVTTTEIPSVKVIDVMKHYAFPIILTTLIVAIYLAIRFRKQNAIKVCIKTIGGIVVIEALYFSMIAICRIPFNELVMPISLLIYILTFMGFVYKLNNKK